MKLTIAGYSGLFAAPELSALFMTNAGESRRSSVEHLA